MIEYDIFRTGLGAAAIQAIPQGEGPFLYEALWQNGAVIAHTGVGIFTLTLDQFAGVLSAAPQVSFINPDAAGFAWSATPDAAGRVWTFNIRSPFSGLLADPPGVLALLILNIGKAGQNS